MATHGQGVHTFGAYLETVEQNLDGDGFEAHPDTPEGYRTDTYHRRRFELSKFGFVDTFVVGETVYRESRQSASHRLYSPDHWAAFEIPLVADPDPAEVLYNDSKPAWGRAYYSGFHETIEHSLTPADWTPVTGVHPR